MGVPVRVFFSRSSEHHSRNDSSSSTSWSHDSHVFSHSRTLVVPGTFLRVLYNIHHHVAFARELEEKEKNTEQDQPALRRAVAAPAPAAAAADVRFSMTCRFVDGQGKRGNVHISVIMSVAFPDVVVFDGIILLCSLLTRKQNARE